MIEIMAVCLLGIMLSLGVLLVAVSKVSENCILSLPFFCLFLQNNDTIMHFTVEQYSDHVDNQLYVYYAAYVTVELGAARFFIEMESEPQSSDHVDPSQSIIFRSTQNEKTNTNVAVNRAKQSVIAIWR